VSENVELNVRPSDFQITEVCSYGLVLKLMRLVGICSCLQLGSESRARGRALGSLSSICILLNMLMKVAIFLLFVNVGWLSAEDQFMRCNMCFSVQKSQDGQRIWL
jgi:hypothetical protein